MPPATARRVLNLHGKIGAGAGLASDTPKACRAARGVTAPNCRNYFLNIVLAACTAGGKARLSRSWSLSGMFCALQARGLFLFCCLGRLRRGQGGAGYGAAPPSRPPLHPPRSTPWGFPVIAGRRGPRGYCCGSFLAALGDLPPRRATPAHTFALNMRPRRRLVDLASRRW